MGNTVVLNEVLFAHHNSEKIQCSNGLIEVGSVAAGNIAKSKARPASTSKTAPVKCSAAAMLLDNIFMEKNIYMASLNGGAQGYAEIVSGTDTYVGVYEAGMVRWLNDKSPDKSFMKLAPMLAYAFAQKKATFESFEKNIDMFGISAKCADNDVCNFCDSFYYEFARKNQIVEEGTLTEADINQCVRTKNYEPLLSKIESSMPSIYLSSTASASDSSTEMPTNEMWESMKAGEKIIPWENWEPDQYEKIPELSTLAKYVPTQDFFDVFDIVSGSMNDAILALDSGTSQYEATKENYANIIFVGKPGTGKTSLAYALGASLGVPVYTVTNSRNTEEDNYEGKNKVVDGKIKFCPTPFLNAYKNGGIIVLEEFNLVPPDVLMGAIGQAVEAPFLLMEDGYKEVRRHPLCVIIATMNTATQGSKDPNEAFTSRFPTIIAMDDPVRDDFISILKSSGAENADCEAVYDIYRSIIDYLVTNTYEDVAMSLTLRHCLAVLKAMKKNSLRLKPAVKRCITNAICVKDLALAKEVYDTVVEPYTA